MRPPARARRSAAATLVVAALLGACSDTGEEAAQAEAVAAPLGFRGEEIIPIDPFLLPTTVLGLDVEVEDVQDRLASVADTYVEALTLFSLRRDDLLMATLQVSRLGGPARPADPGFQREIIGLVGGAAPREVRLGEAAVWITSGGNQRLQTWFQGDHLFVLTIRADYEQPRTLLRRLLEVQT